MKEFSIILIFLCVSKCSLYSQNRIISGRVISDHFDFLIGIPIMTNDNLEVGKTDSAGYFEIEIPVSVKKIVFEYVGLDPATIELGDKCGRIEVVMMLSSTYDFITFKHAERKRRKRFKKLIEIHNQAFENRIFETEYPCYIRNFEPLYLQED